MRALGLSCIAMVGIAAGGTAHAQPPTVAACGDTPPSNLRGLRGVDWCNFDVGAWKGPLHNGHNEVHLYADLGQAHDTILTRLRSVDYGDADGDHRPEAWLVIETTDWFGESANGSTSSTLVVYTWRRGRAVELTSLPIGTPLHELVIGRRQVITVSGPDRARTIHRWSPRARAFVDVAPPPPTTTP